MQNDRNIEITVEERILLQKLKTEAALFRGYPIALVSSYFTYQALTKRASKMKPVLKLSIVLGVGCMGNILGRVSYIPTAMHRLVEQLPENSKLRTQIKQSMSNFSKTGQQNQLKEQVDNCDVTVSYGEGEDKKTYLSYSGLREAHRTQRFGNPLPERTKTETEDTEKLDETQHFEEKSEKNVRYNKYGDPILD